MEWGRERKLTNSLCIYHAVRLGHMENPDWTLAWNGLDGLVFQGGGLGWGGGVYYFFQSVKKSRFQPFPNRLYFLCYRCKFYMANICLARGIYPSRCHCGQLPLPAKRKVAVAIFQRGQSVPRSIFTFIIQINIHVIRLPVLLSTEDRFLVLAWNRDMAKYRNETILPSFLPPHFFQPPINFSCMRRVPYQPNNCFSPKQKQQRNETTQKIAVFTKTRSSLSRARKQDGFSLLFSRPIRGRIDSCIQPGTLYLLIEGIDPDESQLNKCHIKQT